MAWTVDQLNVDFSQNRATVVMDSNGAPNSSINLSFSIDGKNPPDDVARRQVLAQAKRMLTDAASSL